MGILIVPYNPDWPTSFNNLQAALKTSLESVKITSIEHIGSTAVPGLAAKPVIDIDIVVPRASIPAVKHALHKNGYLHLGERGIADRHAFEHSPDPVHGGGKDLKRNVYVVVEDSTALKNHLAIRDTMRENEKLRDEYANIKRDLAEKTDDSDEYCVGKTEFLLKVLKNAGFSSKELKEIEESNTA